jgi:hypothetical protein
MKSIYTIAKSIAIKVLLGKQTKYVCICFYHFSAYTLKKWIKTQLDKKKSAPQFFIKNE